MSSVISWLHVLICFFQGALLLTEVLKERDAQIDMKNSKLDADKIRETHLLRLQQRVSDLMAYRTWLYSVWLLKPEATWNKINQTSEHNFIEDKVVVTFFINKSVILIKEYVQAIDLLKTLKTLQSSEDANYLSRNCVIFLLVRFDPTL